MQQLMENYFTLSDGAKLPRIGFGTYNEEFSDNTKAIETAIECGYRFFDTASLYETERYLGAAVRSSGLKREDFIIETKLWIDEMGYEGAKAAIEKSLKRLDMDYVDIYMIHWPRQTGKDDEDWKKLDIETWKAMEEMVDDGRVKRLGVSNFLPHHLQNLLDNCRIAPVVDQLELHPGCSQERALHYCMKNKVLPMAWSPLGRGRENALAGNEILPKLAKKYGRSIQQICLRFLIQRGILPIPKATTKEHMQSNLEVFDFALDGDDLSMLTNMPQTTWLGEHPDFHIPQMKSNPENI
ncbi:MAG: aldo/keto reductase [Lachnospiraceae bacterium]|nr:aldo/keto reductase [Lachnospiraceae bacterium]